MIKKIFCLTMVMVIVVLVSFSCTRRNSPEDALASYINYRFKVNQSRDEILDRTSGPLHTKFMEMSDEDFSKEIDVKDHRKKKFKILLKKCAPEEGQCSLTYSIRYEILKEGKKVFAVDLKKIAELETDENNEWKIANVNNVKTFIDSKETIEL